MSTQSFAEKWPAPLKQRIARAAKSVAFEPLPCQIALKALSRSDEHVKQAKDAWLSSLLSHLSIEASKLSDELSSLSLSQSEPALSHEEQQQITEELLLLALNILPISSKATDNKPHYTAIRRSCLVYLLAALNIPLSLLIDVEKATAQQLYFQMLEAEREKNKKGSATSGKTSSALAAASAKAGNWKWAATGAGFLAGGLAIGITGGLAAPAIGGLLAGGTGGLLGFLGGTGGAVFIGTLFGLGGGGLTAYRVKRRVEGIEEFEFEQIKPEGEAPEVPSLHATIACAGLYVEEGGYINVLKPTYEVTPDQRDVFAIKVDTTAFLALGKSIESYTWNFLKGHAVKEVLKRTSIQAIMSAVSLPATIYKTSTSLFDSDWIRCLEKSKKAGRLLASVIQDGVQGDRPVMLTGTSLGSVVVFYCLLQLAEEEKPPTDLIYSATLISLPIAPSTEAWQKARSVVAGPLKSAWSGNDWVLALMARMAIHGDMAIKQPAGLGEVQIDGVHNVDLSDLLEGHMDLAKADKLKTVFERVDS